MSQSLAVADLQETFVLEGGPPNFEDVFHEYQRPIYNYLLRMTQNPAEADDLTQETFIRVYRGLSNFRGQASLSTWIYRIATNVSHDHFRRRATQQARAALSFEEINLDGAWADESTPSPEKLVAQSEISACVQGLVQCLPPDYRAVLVLRDLQELKNREIGEVLDIPLSTVKMRLHRARKKLREALNANCDVGYDEKSVFFCEPKPGSEEGC